MIDIDKINDNTNGATVSEQTVFSIGQEIGLIDPISKEYVKEQVVWFTIVWIEPDDDLPIGWLYLMPSNQDDYDGREQHTKPVVDAAGNTGIILYTDMVETISDLIVLPS